MNNKMPSTYEKRMPDMSLPELRKKEIVQDIIFVLKKQGYFMSTRDIQDQIELERNKKYSMNRLRNYLNRLKNDHIIQRCGIKRATKWKLDTEIAEANDIISLDLLAAERDKKLLDISTTADMASEFIKTFLDITIYGMDKKLFYEHPELYEPIKNIREEMHKLSRMYWLIYIIAWRKKHNISTLEMNLLGTYIQVLRKNKKQIKKWFGSLLEPQYFNPDWDLVKLLKSDYPDKKPKEIMEMLTEYGREFNKQNLQEKWSDLFNFIENRFIVAHFPNPLEDVQLEIYREAGLLEQEG